MESVHSERPLLLCLRHWYFLIVAYPKLLFVLGRRPWQNSQFTHATSVRWLGYGSCKLARALARSRSRALTSRAAANSWREMLPLGGSPGILLKIASNGPSPLRALRSPPLSLLSSAPAPHPHTSSFDSRGTATGAVTEKETEYGVRLMCEVDYGRPERSRRDRGSRGGGSRSKT